MYSKYHMYFLGLLSLFAVIRLISATNTNDTQCYTVSSAVTHTVSSVRIMQYNVEWLFLKTYNGCPGTSCTWPNLAEATTHMQYVANVIRSFNPDIVNLCEVEGCYELSQLNGLLGNAYTPYLLFGTDTSTGQNVGVLTKYSPSVSLQRTSNTHTYPVAGSHCNYTGTGSSGVSKHYYTTYKFNELTVYFVGTHLLAIPTEPSRCASREAQASVLQELVVGLLGGIDPKTGQVVKNDNVGLILAGDMNDFDAEIEDANNNQPTSIVLNILKGLSGDYAFTYELSSAAAFVSQSERYTDWWDPNGDCKSSPNEMSMLDHVLMTPNLINKVKNVLMPHTYSEYCGTYNSDHFPIIVDLLL
jgi:endonuclease/exonuclease/phosphatase family metal-dependent hydrolase